MNLSQLPIFKAGLFRQAKYLVSTPQKAQRVLAITETGSVGMPLLPMETGFMKITDAKKAWINIHALKYQVYKNGEPTDYEAVVVLSERSYKPLDVLKTLSPEEMEKYSLKDIAQVRHAQVRAKAGKNDEYKDITTLVITACFYVIALSLVVGMISVIAAGC